MTSNAERLAAVQQLLAKPDERALKTRGHVITQPGKRDRFVHTWLPAVRVWTQRQIGQRAGVVEGWHPSAIAQRGVPRVADYVRRIRILPISLN